LDFGILRLVNRHLKVTNSQEWIAETSAICSKIKFYVVAELYQNSRLGFHFEPPCVCRQSESMIDVQYSIRSWSAHSDG